MTGVYDARLTGITNTSSISQFSSCAGISWPIYGLRCEKYPCIITQSRPGSCSATEIKTIGKVACENIRFSSLFAAGDVLRGETSATQRQKFYTDDAANQCLHNKSASYGVPDINLSNFTCILVDFGKVLCSSANKLPRNSNASSIED